MLATIASADYGYNFDENMEVLRNIKNTGILPTPLDWEQREVLQLTRWTDPKYSNWDVNSGHFIRAFACSLLLLAASDEPNKDYSEGENCTLAQFVSSVIKLSKEIQEAALQFIAWRIDMLQQGEERPFFAFALFALIVILKHQKLTEAEFLCLCDWVMQEESQERAYLDGFCPENEAGFWLLGLTFFNTAHESWLVIADDLMPFSSVLHSDIAQSRIKLIVEQVKAYHV